MPIVRTEHSQCNTKRSSPYILNHLIVVLINTHSLIILRAIIISLTSFVVAFFRFFLLIHAFSIFSFLFVKREVSIYGSAVYSGCCDVLRYIIPGNLFLMLRASGNLYADEKVIPQRKNRHFVYCKLWGKFLVYKGVLELCNLSIFVFVER